MSILMAENQSPHPEHGYPNRELPLLRSASAFRPSDPPFASSTGHRPQSLNSPITYPSPTAFSAWPPPYRSNLHNPSGGELPTPLTNSEDGRYLDDSGYELSPAAAETIEDCTQCKYQPCGDQATLRALNALTDGLHSVFPPWAERIVEMLVAELPDNHHAVQACADCESTETKMAMMNAGVCQLLKYAEEPPEDAVVPKLLRELIEKQNLQDCQRSQEKSTLASLSALMESNHDAVISTNLDTQRKCEDAASVTDSSIKRYHEEVMSANSNIHKKLDEVMSANSNMLRELEELRSANINMQKTREETMTDVSKTLRNQEDLMATISDMRTFLAHTLTNPARELNLKVGLAMDRFNAGLQEIKDLKADIGFVADTFNTSLHDMQDLGMRTESSLDVPGRLLTDFASMLKISQKHIIQSVKQQISKLSKAAEPRVRDAIGQALASTATDSTSTCDQMEEIMNSVGFLLTRLDDKIRALPSSTNRTPSDPMEESTQRSEYIDTLRDSAQPSSGLLESRPAQQLCVRDEGYNNSEGIGENTNALPRPVTNQIVVDQGLLKNSRRKKVSFALDATVPDTSTMTAEPNGTTTNFALEDISVPQERSSETSGSLMHHGSVDESAGCMPRIHAACTEAQDKPMDLDVAAAADCLLSISAAVTLSQREKESTRGMSSSPVPTCPSFSRRVLICDSPEQALFSDCDETLLHIASTIGVSEHPLEAEGTSSKISHKTSCTAETADNQIPVASEDIEEQKPATQTAPNLTLVLPSTGPVLNSIRYRTRSFCRMEPPLFTGSIGNGATSANSELPRVMGVAPMAVMTTPIVDRSAAILGNALLVDPSSEREISNAQDQSLSNLDALSSKPIPEIMAEKTQDVPDNTKEETCPIKDPKPGITEDLEVVPELSMEPQVNLYQDDEALEAVSTEPQDRRVNEPIVDDYQDAWDIIQREATSRAAELAVSESARSQQALQTSFYISELCYSDELSEPKIDIAQDVEYSADSEFEACSDDEGPESISFNKASFASRHQQGSFARAAYFVKRHHDIRRSRHYERMMDQRNVALAKRAKKAVKATNSTPACTRYYRPFIFTGHRAVFNDEDEQKSGQQADENDSWVGTAALSRLTLIEPSLTEPSLTEPSLTVSSSTEPALQESLPSTTTSRVQERASEMPASVVGSSITNSSNTHSQKKGTKRKRQEDSGNQELSEKTTSVGQATSKIAPSTRVQPSGKRHQGSGHLTTGARQKQKGPVNRAALSHGSKKRGGKQSHASRSLGSGEETASGRTSNGQLGGDGKSKQALKRAKKKQRQLESKNQVR